MTLYCPNYTSQFVTKKICGAKIFGGLSSFSPYNNVFRPIVTIKNYGFFLLLKFEICFSKDMKRAGANMQC